MKNNFKTIFLLVAFSVLVFNHTIYAQSIYKISNSKDNVMKLSGTSTLHKWAMHSETFTGDAQFGFKTETNNQLNTLKALSFSLATQDLKSGEKGLDKNAYKALKTDQYKNIVYKLTSANVLPPKENTYLIKTHGNLTIAGVTKEVAIDVYCLLNNDASITCTGLYNLKMSDYQVKPPTFMFGAMKTGDDITLDFTLVYKK